MAQYDVRERGAVADGETVDTGPIQEAIDACAEAGGGRVVVPAGEYLTGPLFLRSDVNFHLEAGATLLGIQDPDAYPVVEGRSGGVEREVYASILTGEDLENVSITGRGTIDGRGEPWWDDFRHDSRLVDEYDLGREDRFPRPSDEFRLDYPRPFTIDLYRCTDVLIRDITIRNSPSWTVHPTYCESVTVDGVTIRNPEESENTDGINPDSCRNVRIANCHVDVGDDCITIKSGYDADGRRVGEPCENIVVTNCTMERGHGGVVIGSEMSGDVRNVTVTDCVFDGTDNGLRIKTERGRGGVVENVRATGIVMNDLQRTAFICTMFYHDGEDEPRPIDEGTPRIRNVHYSDITVDGTRNVTTIRGLAERPVEDVSLVDVTVSDADRGVRATGIDGLYCRNVSVDAAETPAFDVQRATDLELERVGDRDPGPAPDSESESKSESDSDPDPDTPVIRLTGADALVRSCAPAGGTGTFVERGPDDEVVFLDNYFDGVDREIVRE
jgi:polygalacturonase